MTMVRFHGGTMRGGRGHRSIGGAIILFSLVLLMLPLRCTVEAVALPGIPAPPVSMGDSGNWPMFRNDPSHTGFSVADAPDSASIHWSYSPGERLYCSSPAVANGRVYLARYDDYGWFLATCLNAETGVTIWETPLEGYPNRLPAVADGKVFFGTSGEEYTFFDGSFVCLDAATGDPVWGYSYGSDTSASSPVISGPFVYFLRHRYVEYTYYWWTIRANIDCRRVDDGSLLWSHSITDYRFLLPAVHAGKNLYVGLENIYGAGQRMLCFDAISGALIWESESMKVDSSPAIANDRVYVGCYNDGVGETVCLNAADGEVVWSSDYQGTTSPALGYAKVFIGSRYSVVALEQATGNLCWELEPGGWISSSPAVADGKVYFGTSDGMLYCIGADDGEVIWSIEVGPGGYSSSPAIADNRCYYVSGDRLTLYAIGEPIPASVNAELGCTPDSGTLPFVSTIWVTVDSAATDGLRSIAARINLALANGRIIPNWRSGLVQLAPEDFFVHHWNQLFPAVSSLDGLSSITFHVMDVSPPPYNHPPYGPAGATDTDCCWIEGYLTDLN